MVINRYKNTTPWKALARDLVYLSRSCYLYLRNGFKHKTVLFYPDMPYRKSAIYNIMMSTNYNMTNNPKQKFDLVISWEDATRRKHNPLMADLSKKYRIVNYHCSDISKEKVEEIFEAVFGYSSLVDPLQFEGECVEKSTLNGTHDAKVIQCPIMTKKPGYIYQKLIKDEENGMALNYRIPIFGESIPFLTQRYKPLTDRFDRTESARFVDLQEAFTKDEIAKTIEFCKRLGLEYGELDAMRDKDDGRLYILDANNTPTIARLQTSIKISDEDRKILLKASVRAFEETFLKSSTITGKAFPPLVAKA